MDRRTFLSAACLIPLFGRGRPCKEQPTLADPAPQGWKIIDRTMMGKKEQVTFKHPVRNILRIFLGGRYQREINFETPCN